MGLFQCGNCGCCDNTGLTQDGFTMMTEVYDWSYAPERRYLKLCSACGPSHYKAGGATPYAGKWHDRFPRVYLPKGKFVTNNVGNLAHRETGIEGYTAYILEGPDGD